MAGRRYTIDINGKKVKVPSVTTITGKIDKSFLRFWDSKLAKQAITYAMSWYIERGVKVDPEWILEKIDWWMAESSRVAKLAADEGTAIHQAVEDYYNEGYVNAISQAEYINICHELNPTPLQNGWFVADYMVKWFETMMDNEITIVTAEEQVDHKDFLYSGKLDAYGTDKDGGIIIDIKVTNSLKYEYMLQTEAYRQAKISMLKEHAVDDGNLNRRSIMWFNREAPYKSNLIWIPEETNEIHWLEFLALKGTYEGELKFNRTLGKEYKKLGG